LASIASTSASSAAGPPRLRARRLLEQELRQQRREIVGVEGRRAREALEHDRTEREHVGARIGVPAAARLLRRHVADGAHDRARAREPRALPGEPRDPEIEHFDAIDGAAHEEEVRRLDVAMNDPARVRGAERLGHVPRDRHRIADRERPAREALAQILAVEPLHHEVRLAALGRAVRERAHDARVAHGLEQLRLARETCDLLLAARKQDLHRRGRSGVAIDGAEDPPHPAGRSRALDHEAPRDDVTDPHSRGMLPRELRDLCTIRSRRGRS
jgi:hypothetical protein